MAEPCGWVLLMFPGTSVFVRNMLAGVGGIDLVLYAKTNLGSLPGSAANNLQRIRAVPLQLTEKIAPGAWRLAPWAAVIKSPHGKQSHHLQDKGSRDLCAGGWPVTGEPVFFLPLSFAA